MVNEDNLHSDAGFGEDNQPLPRIISFSKDDPHVPDDIFIFDESDWVGKDVNKKLTEKDEEAVVWGLNEGGLNRVLEEVVGGSMKSSGRDNMGALNEPQEDGSDFYGKGSGVGDFYEGGVYDEKAGSEGYDGSAGEDESETIVDDEESRRGGRSMLEIAGFQDEDREEKREEKRLFRE